MPESPNSYQELFAELKRRRVFRVMAVYGVVGFVLLQVVELAVPALLLPEWTYRLVALFLLVGFPIAIVLAWAFEQTPAGLKLTEPASPEEIAAIVGQPPSRRWPAGLLALAGVALLIGGWWMGRSGSSPSSDEASSGVDVNMVAVLPFRASVPDDLSYLGEGFMDLLSTRLDGQVGPRAVDPAAVTGKAADGADPGSVARALGAGLVVTGSVVGGATSIVASAEFRNVLDSAIIANASAEGHPDSIAAIADELIGEFLSLSAGEHPESVARLTSTSPEALKAYLRGKQAWRNGDYYAAPALFDEALAHDSTFALAGIARADGAVNTIGVGSGGGLELAWRHRDRLGPWDRKYLEARLPQSPRTRREMERTFENLTRELPHRIEAWYWLGESRIHGAGVVKDSTWAESVRAAFGKSLEIDPGYRPSLDHLALLELQHGTPERARKAAVASYRRPGQQDSTWLLVEGLVVGSGTLTMDPADLATANQNRLTFATWWPHLATDYLPENWIDYVDEAFAERRRRVGGELSLGSVLYGEYSNNLAIGRPGRALAARDEAIRAGVMERYSRETVYAAIWYGVSREDAEETVRRITARVSAADPGTLTMEDARDLWTADIWRFHGGEAYASTEASERILPAGAADSRPDSLEREALSMSLRAWAQVRRGESAENTISRIEAILEEVPGGLAGSTVSLLSLARILEEADRPERALHALGRADIGTITRADLFQREKGRLAAAIGDTTRALQEYGRYLTVMAHSEPEMAAEVEAVRRESERLWGERTPVE